MKLTKTGFALLEALFSMAFLGLLVLGLAYMSKSSMSGRTLEKQTCQNVVDAMIGTVDSFKNALFMRNYIPATSVNTGPGVNSGDPFCNSTLNICNSNPFYGIGSGMAKHATGFWRNPARMFNGTTFNTLRYLYNYQNIRGSAAWAQSLYNQNLATICNGKGLATGNATGLNNMMPRQMAIGDLASLDNAGALGFLYIKDQTVNCGVVSESDSISNGSLTVKATIDVPATNGTTSTCAAETQLAFPQDSQAPRMTIALTNAGGISFLNGAKSDGGVTGTTDYRTVNIDITASEAGLIYLCRRVGPVAADPAGDYTLCQELTLPGATTSSNPDYSTPTFNGPTNLRLTFAGLTDNALPYGVEITAVDVGGNFSATTITFIVQSP